MASSTATDEARSARLSSFFTSVIKGKRTITAGRDSFLLLEAFCDQTDSSTCVQRVVASDAATDALRASLRFDISVTFINNHLEKFLRYLRDPVLKQICNGDFLNRLLILVVDPPPLWNAIVQAHKQNQLTSESEHAFAWLLLKLLTWNANAPDDTDCVAQEVVDNGTLINSDNHDVRTLGQRVKHVLHAKSISLPALVSGPGGRHDNDYSDFRQITIFPTEDEIMSKDRPFYRHADAVNETPADQRVAVHFDNQFRLLREDMLAELRDDLKTSQTNKGRKANARLRGLTLAGFHCGAERRRSPFAITVTCKSGLERLASRTSDERKSLLKDDRKFLKHQSFGCLMENGKVIAFATLDRNEDLLAAEPPLVCLRIPETKALARVLMTLKMSKDVEFLLVDTAMFSYEPVLECLQNKVELPLADELLFLREDESKQNVQPSEICPDDVAQDIQDSAGQHVDETLDLPKPVDLDPSQTESLLAGLKQTVSLIQGPPGTGKSFIGALLAKAFHDHTRKKILVICYTNHALDQFLEDLLDIGIPDRSMVRLGAKSSSRTEHLSLFNQASGHGRTQASWAMIDKLNDELNTYESSLRKLLSSYTHFKVKKNEILEYLEFSDEGSDFFDAFQLPAQQDNFTIVDEKGHAVNEAYLFDRWSKGEDAGVFEQIMPPTHANIWKLEMHKRREKLEAWTRQILDERVSSITKIVKAFDESQKQLHFTFNEQKAEILRQKRIVACTTTAAAKYSQQLQTASPDIILVEEAGEILESHVLTAMTPHTKQLVLIGDHQQLRPKVNNYALTVEKGDGYDLNRSLFERLILAGFPHTTLAQQHRMSPEISTLVRHLTYHDLRDAPKTQNRPALRGLQDRVIFFNHQHLEVSERGVADRRDQGSNVSKKNEFEAEIVLQVVRYLAQQGYGTSEQAVLTPYLGQLSLLRRRLGEENDPILNDLDSFDLVKAGLLAPSSAAHKKRPIKISTIDNYQGEESDIVIVSLTRANKHGDIGFMTSPERLNVLLSRARNGLILIGNSDTFLSSKKGKTTWRPLFDLLGKNGHIYDGLPVKCEQHPDKKMVLKQRSDFKEHCPDGGCSEPCGAKLVCGIHDCPQKCHQLSDHSQIKCQRYMSDKCDKGHQFRWRCFAGRPTSCKTCNAEAQEKARKAQRDADLDEKRQNKQREYARELSELQDEIAHERRLRREQAEQDERDRTLRQHQKDLQDLRSGVAGMSISGQKAPEAQSPQQRSPLPKTPPQTAGPGPTSQSQQTLKRKDSHQQKGTGPWKVPESPAKDEWEYQKKFEGASNDILDELMGKIGLENVKQEFLDIKDKVEVAIRQNIDMKDERFGASLLGNPGTGKTTVARLYAKFLSSLGALPGHHVEETSGSRLANDGVSGCQKLIDNILNSGGGALFIDEAYQLASGNSPQGRQVLDFLLAEVENLTGKIVFILAGYNKQMESFFAHNPGIPSRFPREIQFKDYKNEELLEIINYGLNKRYRGQMKVELGCRGLYARIVARRIGRGRDREGFGNARAVENTIVRIVERQAKRLRKERKSGGMPDDFLLTQEDLLGPEPQDALKDNSSWEKLQELIGLDSVKNSIRALFDTMQYNYTRELDEEPLIDFSLNKVFLGNPGTGKTTVAKLYGQILADMGFLSSGEMVVKNPSDFIGAYIGHSERNTKGILAATLGKVLVIDEAYSLYDHSSKGSNANTFKTSVIDTIVAEVQSVPGDDRCVLLLGYREKMEEMFQNVNPGLTRRFPLDSAFNFEDFTDAELESIFDLKLKQLGFKTTKDGKKVALEMLSRARNRLNFGNAGEVDILFNKAKLRHQQRIAKGKQKIAAIFEAPDFDPDFERGERAATNVDMLFNGVIGCEEIVAQLKGYQTAVANLKALDMNPYEQLPFTFLFRGPPGTGKTTTAERMGKVYYDMGFLATAEVIVCSASEMIGQYVGHTGPKTQALFEKALGKILFIDEAYRLGDGHFAKEAIDEMVDCITKEKFANKMIIILAGYEADINRLMTINPGLTSRFPETMTFRALTSQECLALLTLLLKNKNAKKKVLDVKVLDPPSDAFRGTLVKLFDSLAALPNWANARDVKTLVKNIFGKILRTENPTSGARVVSEQCVIDELERMLRERVYRARHLRPRHPASAPPPPQALDDAPSQGPASAGGDSGGADDGAGRDGPKESPPEEGDKISRPESQRGPAGCDEDKRDAGVSDAVWEQLQRDKMAAKKAEQEYQGVVKEEGQLKKEIEKAEAEAEAEADEKDFAGAKDKEHTKDGQKGQDQGDGKWEGRREDRTGNDEQEKQERERLRLEKIMARRRIDEEAEERRKQLEQKKKELAELERRRIKMEEARRKEKEKQECLKKMGVCPMGFVWIKQSGGYRCAGGSHFVSDADIARYMY